MRTLSTRLRPSIDIAPAVGGRFRLAPPVAIALIAFLFSAAVTSAIMAMPFFVFYQLGGGAMMSGLFAGIQAACYALISLVSSRFVARAKNGMVWAVTGVSGFMLFMCCMPLFREPWLCGALFCAAFAMSALAWPAFHSWVGAEHDPKRRGRNMGLLNVAWSVGGAAGPFLTGPLYEIHFWLPFLLVAVVCVAALALLRGIPHESAYFGVADAGLVQLRAAHDQASEAFLMCAWCATFMSHISIGATRAVFPKRLDDIIAAGSLRIFAETTPLETLNAAAATRFSWLIVATGLATGLTFFIMGRTSWWHHRFSVLLAAQALTALAMWTLGHTHSLAVMLLAFAVIGVNLGAAFFSSVYYSMANPLRKHGRAAINEGLVGAGGLLGGLGFALVAERAGLPAPFHYMPILILLIIAVQAMLLHKRRILETGRPAPLAQ